MKEKQDHRILPGIHSAMEKSDLLLFFHAGLLHQGG